MRLHLRLTPSKETIPFNYQAFLTGTLHKWIGEDNAYHGKGSLYSFSWLQRVEAVQGKGLRTTEASSFFISAHDGGLLKEIVWGIQRAPEVCFGASVSEIQILDTPTFAGEMVFSAASPVLVKQITESEQKHLTYDDEAATGLLTKGLQRKLEAAGLSHEGVQVRFDSDYTNARTKIIHYKSIGNRVNICPVIVSGTPEQIGFAWNVGVGNSTGIGFGALK